MAAESGNNIILERNHTLTDFGYIIYIMIAITCLITLLIPFIDPDHGLGYQCVFSRMTGIPCPTCGYSRAVHSVFKGMFIQGFLYNPVWILLIFYQILCIYISIKSIIKSRSYYLNSNLICFFIVALLVNWILKLWIGEQYY